MQKSLFVLSLILGLFPCRLLAAEEFQAEVRASTENSKLTDEEVAKLKSDDNLSYKALEVTGHFKNTGMADLTGVTIKTYVVVGPDPVKTEDQNNSFRVIKVFTNDNQMFSAGYTLHLDLGKVALPVVTTSSKFGQEEASWKFEGIVVRFYQDGKCLGTKISDNNLLLLPAAEEEDKISVISPAVN